MKKAKKKAAKKRAKRVEKNRVVDASPEAVADRKMRVQKIVKALGQLYPDATCALHFDSALQLLVATILSAQSTDETVNRVTPVLFERYPTAADFAEAFPEELEELVHSTGFFRQKSKNIIAACAKIVNDFGGDVPDTMDELTQLPGVARKSANVLLGTWFEKNEGVVVDTHVGRLACRLDLTWTSKDSKDAVKIERDLMEIVPQKDWTFLSHGLVWHGRKVCDARKPNCKECTLNKLCPSAFAFET